MTGTAPGATGSHPIALSRGVAPGHSSDTFLSLLFQDQMDSRERATSATSTASESAGSVAGATQETSAQKPLSPLAGPISTETQTLSKRRKATDDSGAAAPAVVAQIIDLSAAARWLLSLTCGNGSPAAPTASLDSGVDAELRTKPSGQVAAAASPAQGDNAITDSAFLFDPPENPTGGVDNAIRGATLGTVEAAPIAELRLTPIAIPAATNLGTVVQSTHSLTPPSSATSSTRRQEDSSAGPQPQGVSGRNAVPGTRGGDLDHEDESSLDQSASSQQAVFAASKKKVETGNTQRDEPTAAPDPGGSDQGAATSPTATPLAEPQSTRTATEAPAAASSALEPPPTEPAKPSTSSVGTIELQVRGADEQQVGLRFVERQGRVEIQLKSGDVQTAQALSDNLAGLKTSLNENGWNVDSRIQDRLSSAGQGFQPVASADQFGSPQSLRTEQLSMGQMNRQSGSDSSAGKGHSGPHQDGSSSRNGQQAENENTGPDSERQGRRSARDSEAWLESIESNLTRSPSRRIATGVTK